MRESLISQNLVKYNKQYLELYFSDSIQRELRKKRKISRLKIFIGFIKHNRTKELMGLINKRIYIGNHLKKPTGDFFKESVDATYMGDFSAVVYTAIFGNRTPINEPLFVNKKYKYVIFTDLPVDKDSAWIKMEVPNEMPKGLDNASKNRWLKLHPHILFPDCDYSVYVDGGIILVGDMMPLVEGLGTSFFASHIMAAPVDCVYESSKAVISSGKAPKNLVEKQMSFYKEEGYPEHYGMFENGVLVRNHMNERCIKLMEDWWSQMLSFSMRDQMSLGYVMWKNDVKDEEVKILGRNIYKNPRFRFYDLHL